MLFVGELTVEVKTFNQLKGIIIRSIGKPTLKAGFFMNSFQVNKATLAIVSKSLETVSKEMERMSKVFPVKKFEIERKDPTNYPYLLNKISYHVAGFSISSRDQLDKLEYLVDTYKECKASLLGNSSKISFYVFLEDLLLRITGVEILTLPEFKEFDKFIDTLIDRIHGFGFVRIDLKENKIYFDNDTYVTFSELDDLLLLGELKDVEYLVDEAKQAKTIHDLVMNHI